MKTFINRIVILLSIALLTSQCKKDKNKNETIAGTKDEWVALSKDNKDFGDDAWGFQANNKIYMFVSDPWFHVYDVQQKKWTEETKAFPNDFMLRYSCLLAQHNNKIYIAGGLNMGNILRDFWEYNPANSEWVKLSDMPVPLSGGNLYVYDNHFYAGIAATTPHTSQSQRLLYKYSLASNTWDPTPVELNSYAGTDGISFQKGEDIYYGGGYGYSSGDPNPKAFYKYNLKTGVHIRLADMPTTFIENARPNTFILKEKMYAAWSGKMIVYDPALNTWNHYTNLPLDEGGHGIYYSFQIGNRVISFTQTGSAFEYL